MTPDIPDILPNIDAFIIKALAVTTVKYLYYQSHLHLIVIKTTEKNN